MQPYGGGQLPWPATSNSASKPPATDKNKKKKKKKKKWLRWAIPLAVVVIAITILGACLGTQLNKHPKATPMRLGNGTITAPPTKLTALPMTAAGDEDCTTLHGITYTFYGYPDNDPPGAAIAYECPGRGPTAGGTGTYDDPLTFATAPGEFELCEVIYSPYLQKYLIHEDYCASCTRHWPHMWHVDVWLGGDSVGAAAEQLSCEARLTPALESQSVVRGPRGDLVVDDTTFYAGGYSACGVDHVYDAAGGADDYC